MAQATAWADSLPDGNLKSSAFDEIAENYVREDLEGAKSWIAEHAHEDYAGRAVREVAEELSRESPESALAWADTLPENAQAESHIRAFGPMDPTDVGHRSDARLGLGRAAPQTGHRRACFEHRQ